MELKLHDIHSNAIDQALAKARQYRSLLEPEIAESICLDVLNIDPEHQTALVLYILALLDQISRSDKRVKRKTVEQFIAKLDSEYQRYYYLGLLNERMARYMISQTMSHSFAYDYFYDALNYYQQAEQISPEQNDEATLRWNSCLRTIEKEQLHPRRDSDDVLVDMES